METVFLVAGVLGLLFVINWRRHERDMRLRAERVRVKQRSAAMGARRDV